ncbi:MAG: NAD(P)/FAD-dependent oxidoreductase [Acidobacteriaceae bacterium]|nr:NAD(P)/FAD-dependent oxidoreductase [Acidobacteriaceae bacterium]
MTDALPSEALYPDVLIVGAGPAGMAAAVRSCESGARVLVIDDNPGAGGQIWRGQKQRGAPSQSAIWFQRFAAMHIPFLTSAQVISIASSARTLLAETSGQSLELRFRKLVIATGAREIFLPFPGWTLPGITGVGGLQALAKSGMPVTGKSIIVAGSGPLLLAVAAYLRKAGAHVKLIAEQISRRAAARFLLILLSHPSKVSQAAALRFALAGTPYRFDCWVEAAEGDGRLRSLQLRQGERTWTEECDYAAVAYGLYPNNEIPSLLGCRMQGATVVVNKWQQSSVDHVYCAGECTGIGGVDLSLIEGEIAGYASCGKYDLAQRLFGKREEAQKFAGKLNKAFALREELKLLPQGHTLVCRCEDVSYGKLKNMPSFRGAKLHTRCGMGPCQGRVCGPAAEFLFGWRTESVRPPIFPARIGSFTVDNEEDARE